MFIKLVPVIIFVCVMVGVGIYSMKRTKTLNDFYLGGRSVGPWMSAFAFGTTYFSAVLFVGYAGKLGWGFGLSDLWVVVGNTLIGSYLAWKVLAKPTREMTARLGAMTMPEFLAERYDSQTMKIVSAIIIFVFLVPYSASVFTGLTYLFEKVFFIPYTYALIFMALLTAVYLTLGGYLAVALNDFIQGIIMIFGVIAMLFFVLRAPEVGGLAAGIAKLAEIDPQLTAVVPADPTQKLVLFSMVILTSLGTWGLPQMIQKFYAIKDEAAIKPATFISTLFALLMAFGAYFTGSLTHLFFNELPVAAGKPNPDLLMPMILTQALPEVVAVLILLLVLSASMSTLASLVLVSSSAVAVDLVKGVLMPDISKEKSMLLTRILSLVFIALSVILALKPRLILSLMALSWGAVAGSFLAPYFWGLYSKKITRAGAWVGMFTGLATMVLLSTFFDPAYIPLYGSLAMIIPLFVTPIVSLFTEPFSEQHLEKVFGESKIEASTSTEKSVIV